MKKTIYFLFIIFSLGVVKAQQIYAFDYYTLYEYEKSENSKEKMFELTYSNSKNPDYHFIVLVTKGKAISNYLLDNDKKISHLFEPVKSLTNIPTATLQWKKSFPFEVKTKEKNAYEIMQMGDSIKVTRYRNAQKKKIINECIITTIPTDITEYSRYNFFPFRNPLFIDRFDYNNPNLIQYSYFIENGKKVHLRKLLEIMQTNFKITVPN